MNPIATKDQIRIESAALSLRDAPMFRRAAENARMRWKTIAGKDVPAEASGARFEELIEEYCFAYLLKAVNSDANRPLVLRNNYGPPHRWFGQTVPGCRAGGGDNVDNDYSYFPIDGYARYELTGRRFVPGTVDVPVTVSGNVSQTMPLAGLDWQDMVMQDDSTFVITIGPEAAQGRSNHLQTTLDACCVFIRDCRSDWNQIPNAYEIRRLDPPVAPPPSEDQILARAFQYIVDSVTTMYWWMRVMDSLEINRTPLVDIGSMGGLSTQKLSLLRLSLKDDEAFILHTRPGTARYHSVILHDFWFRTFDYWNQTSTLNNAQSHPQPDGSLVYVVSHEDPGVHNWLDTKGMRELLVCVRWQAMSRNRGQDEEPWISGKVVRFSELASVLPGGVKEVDAAGRAQQLAERLRSFSTRFDDSQPA